MKFTVRTSVRWAAVAAGLGTVAALAVGAAEPSAEREVGSRPTAVTVYPDAARVEREADADLPAGPVTVTFSDLPATADEGSLRLAVKGPKGTKFHGVRLRSALGSKASERRVRELNEKLRDLADQKARLDDRIMARNAEMDILKTIGKDAAGRTGASGGAGSLAQVAEGSKAVGKRILELMTESRQDQIAARDIQEQLAVVQRELGAAGGGATDRRVAEAELTLAAGGRTEFTLTYLVRAASWAPVYDLTLDSGSKQATVGVSFGASVRQQSGEDWNNVALTLSTARPTADTRVPDPTNWWLDLWRPQPQPVYRKASRRAGKFAPAAADAPSSVALGAAMEALEPEPEPVQMDEAAVERAEFATHFRIERKVSVPTGGESRRVGIGESVQTAELTLVAVPRLVAAAFVEAKVEYKGEEPLLPGTAQLFQGGEFVGTVALPSVGPGETITLGFGQDAGVKVERKLKDTKAADKGLLGMGKASRRYRWVTTLTSSHQGPRTIEVREQLPRSRHAEVTVEPLEMKPEPLAEDPATPGLQRFKIELAPGKPATVVFSYQVKFPQNTRISGLE